MFIVLMIAALIIAGGLTAIGGGRMLSAGKRKRLGSGQSLQLLSNGSGSDLQERDFDDLRVGDIVMHGGKDFIVEGLIKYDEAGHRWSMARIVDVQDDLWLLVGLERTGGSSKKLLQISTHIDVNGYPPEVIVHGEYRYNFDKRGTATASLSGDTGSLGGGGSQESGCAHRCRWWNYSTGDQALLVEQWGDDYRVLIGSSVGQTDIEMMPAS